MGVGGTGRMTIYPFVQYVRTDIGWKGSEKREFSGPEVWISGALCIWLCAKRCSKNESLGLISNE